MRHTPSFLRRLMREKTLTRYLSALERGDIDTLITILQQSSEDAVLEQMIFDVHEAYESGEQLLATIQEVDNVEFKEGIHKSLPAGELPLQGQAPSPQRKSYRPWFRLLAAVLVVCMLGGGIVVIQILRAPHMTVESAQHGWCQIPVVGLNTNIGAPTLYGITAASANDIWLVGSLGDSQAEPSQTLIEHWDGTRLRVLPSPNSGQNGNLLVSVSEISPENVWAVGAVLIPQSLTTFPSSFLPSQHTLIEHWNGQQWSVVPSPDGTTAAHGVNALQSVAAISADDIWAFGYTGRLSKQGIVTNQSSLVEHWNGRQWSIVSLPSSLHITVLHTIIAAADGGLWASGYSTDKNGDLLLVHWNGQQWSSIQDLVTDAELYSLNVQSANDIWATGQAGGDQTHPLQTFIAHWNGANWQKTIITNPPLISTSSHILQGISSFTATSLHDAWAVGGQSAYYISDNIPAFMQHWDGRSWHNVPFSQHYAGVLSVLAVIDGKVWAAGTIYTGFQQLLTQVVETTC